MGILQPLCPAEPVVVCYWFPYTLTMAKVCQPAPAFKATALVGKDFKEVSLNDYAGSKFEAANVQLLGCSVDSQFSHLAWVNTPRKQGGLGGALNFPLLADLDKKISQDYGVLLDGGIACRGLFIISDKGVVRHITMNDPPVGRSVDEVLRLVQAYKHTDEVGEVCPANWTPGADTMVPDPVKSQAYFSKHG